MLFVKIININLKVRNMKINIKNALAALGLLVLFMAGTAFLFQQKEARAAEQPIAEEATDNFGILLRKENHLRVAVRTAGEIEENSRFRMGAFEIVVCGPDVAKLKKNGALTATLEQASRLGVQVKACGISLEKFGVKADSLAPEVSVVPNGLMRAFELEKEGYLMIEL
jgi:intracellular sulfur oxidation DsrE/DsrF family protein